MSASRDANGNAVLAFNGSADNPLANPSASIDYSLTITASSSGYFVTIGGSIDGFPAVEVNVTTPNGATVPLFQFDPTSVDNGLMSLLPIVGDQAVSVSCSGVGTGDLSCQ